MKLLPHIRKEKYIRTPEFDRWSCLGDGLREYQYATYISWFKRTLKVAWVWAENNFGQKTKTPFSHKMNYTAWEFKVGFLYLHMSKKQNY